MSDKITSSNDVTDVLASIRKLVSDEARARSTIEPTEAQREAEEILKEEARALAREKEEAEKAEAVAALRAEKAAREEAEAKAAEEAKAQAEAQEAAQKAAEAKAEAEAKAAAEAEAKAAAEAEAQAKAEEERKAQALAEAKAQAEASRAKAAQAEQDDAAAADVPSFPSDEAPLVLTSSQRVADTVSATAKAPADAPENAQEVSDNSAALPSFLAISAGAKDVSLLDDVPEDEAAQVEDLMVQSPQITDEAALRELVRSVVQEELQGEMGDRITRNLRKLIRHEITSMLTPKEQ